MSSSGSVLRIFSLSRRGARLDGVAESCRFGGLPLFHGLLFDGCIFGGVGIDVIDDRLHGIWVPLARSFSSRHRSMMARVFAPCTSSTVIVRIGLEKSDAVIIKTAASSSIGRPRPENAVNHHNRHVAGPHPLAADDGPVVTYPGLCRAPPRSFSGNDRSQVYECPAAIDRAWPPAAVSHVELGDIDDEQPRNIDHRIAAGESAATSIDKPMVSLFTTLSPLRPSVVLRISRSRK